jgi:anhydro-N-acetylmuramic acid kinase
LSTPAYIGLMSGTSMDAIDAVLVSFHADQITIHGTHSHPYPAELAASLRRLSQNEGTLDEASAVDHRLGHLFAEAALAVIKKSAIPLRQIRAIGSHGQTLRHQPSPPNPFSLQVGDPSIIAERTGIAVVADFRKRDLAAGGQGAPLAPAFHNDFFGQPGQSRCILNLGGIGNITWLPGNATQPAIGFDTGPGNGLMDAWILKNRGQAFDASGRWARQGKVDEGLLKTMLADRYFSRPAPKSTGKEHFNLNWVERMIAQHTHLAAEDVQRTLLELTVRTVIAQLPDQHCDLYVCGGGALNDYLMARFSESMPAIAVSTTSPLGLDPEWVEGVAFAWLAQRFMDAKPGNLPAVTGASGERILGALYPA